MGEEGGALGSGGAAGTGTGMGTGGELTRRGLLGPRIRGVIVLATKILEKGEKFGT